MMDEIKAGLRYAFQTRNKLTLAISASGHSGMEASIGNLLERGESLLVARSGHWGDRAADIANRLGIHVSVQLLNILAYFDEKKNPLTLPLKRLSLCEYTCIYH